jgi:hypothetical protein
MLSVISVATDITGQCKVYEVFRLSFTVVASSSLDSHIKLWNLKEGKIHSDIDTGPGTL